MKKLSSEAIKQARGKIKMLGEEILADRESLIQDELETLKYRIEMKPILSLFK